MKYWSDKEKIFVFENIKKMSISDIAKCLGKTENCLNIFIHRNRNHEKLLVKDSLLRNILDKKFIKAEYFNPTRKFFDQVQIGQKRYWALYRGSLPIKEEEIIRIADYLEIDFKDIYDCRQLSLFEKNNE